MSGRHWKSLLFCAALAAGGPSASRLIVGRSVDIGVPKFSSKMDVYRVKGYENEPLELTLESSRKSMMDMAHIEPERGFLNETGRVVFRPRGAQDSKTFYMTDYEHSVENNVTVIVETVPSYNAQIYDLRPSNGYLEPQFSQSHYSYFLRVPEGASKGQFRLTAVDDVNTVCSYNQMDDTRGRVQGKGVTGSISYGSGARDVVVLECVHPNKPEYPVRYMLQVVPQKGGSTKLRDLQVDGAELQQKFDPAARGVYTADISNIARDDKNPKWVSFKAIPENKKANVTIEGIPVDENWNSPFFRIPLGETRLFHVRVQTPQNPVAETYTITVARMASLGWGGKLLGLVSTGTTMMASTRAYHFLHNFHVLQWIDSIARIPGLPEAWTPTASVTDKFNWVFESPKVVSFLDQEGRPYDNSKEPFYVDEQPTVSQETPFGHLVNRWALDVLPNAFAYKGNRWVPTFADANVIKLDLARQESEEAERQRRRQLTGLANVEEIENEAFFDCQAGDDCAVKDRSSTVKLLGMRRRLQALDAADRGSLLSQLEASYNSSSDVLMYSRRLMLVFVSLIAITVGYVACYILYTRSHGLSSLDLMFPRWMHPVRFAIFVLDLCAVAITQSAFGLFFSPLKHASIKVAGVSTTPRHLGVFGLVMFALFVVGFFVVVTGQLGRISNRLVFANVFSRWHDVLVPTIKAFYQPLRFVPIIGRICSVEIRDVAPIATFRNDAGKNKNEEGIVDIMLVEDSRTEGPWLEGRATDAFSAVHGPYSSDESQRLVDKPAIKYYKKTDETGVFLDMINFQDEQYPNRNAKAMHEYPEAFVAHCKRPVYNFYGQAIECHAEVQLKHLPALADKLEASMLARTIAPRENLDMPNNDSYSNVIANSQKGNLFWWVCERGAIWTAVALAAAIHDESGKKQMWIFGVCACLLLMLAIPCVFATSLSDYWYQMECDLAVYKKAAKYEHETQQKFRVWPYRSKTTRQQYVQISQKNEENANKYAAYRIWNEVYGTWCDFVENPAWRSRAVTFVRIFATHQAMTETLKILACLTLLFGSVSIAKLSEVRASNMAASFCAIALLCINYESIRLFLHECRMCAVEVYYESRTGWLFIRDLVKHPQEFSERIRFYVNKCFEALHANSVSFIFPGFQSESVHEMAVKDVSVVNNQMGTVMPGFVEKTRRAMRAIDDEDNPLIAPCHGIQKTLHMANGVGVYRSEIYRGLPIEMPLADMLCEEDKQIKNKRLVATFQIVNHNYIRYIPNLQHTSDDDSFLSLYTDPDLVPGAGDLRKQYLGPGMVAAYDPAYAILRIKGPGIVAGKVYDIKVTDKKPAIDNTDLYTEPSEGVSSEHHGVDAVGVVACSSPGVLNVPVDEHKAPNLCKPLKIREVKSDECFEIDPVLAEVTWDETNRIMVIYHERFLVSSDEADNFEVFWSVRPNAKTERRQFPGVKALKNGELVVALSSDDPVPYMNKSLYIRVRCQDKSVCLDVDPSDTNAHEFPLATCSKLPRGPGNSVVEAELKVRSELDTWFGHQTMWDAPEERIPCTVVMCVDPIAQDYRVEPDFYAARKRCAARITQFKALKNQAIQKELLWLVWPKVMSQSEYADFWRGMNVNVFEDGKRLIDPTFETGHPQVNAQKQRITNATDYLVREIMSRADQHINDLEKKRAVYREWHAAYDYKAFANDGDTTTNGDVTLYDLYCEWQDARMRNDPDEALYMERFRNLRSLYERTIPGFVYPMIVNSQFLSRSPNWEAQFDRWHRQVHSWLTDEETPKVNEPNIYGHYYHPVVRQFLTSLRQNLFKQERLTVGRTSTVLHFVSNSLAIRGPDYYWKPDPLGSMFACVRVWRTNSMPDSTADAKWLTCMVKLTANSVKIMLCDPAFNPGLDVYDWNKVYGWRIPLECFEKMEMGIDVNPAADNVYLRTMTGEVTCRKNMAGRVDDSYVESVATGEISNAVMPVYGKQTYYLMNGFDTKKDRIPANVPIHEQSESGALANVYPLKLRLYPRDLERWQSAVRACGMNYPRQDAAEFTYRDPNKIPQEESPVSVPRQTSPPKFQDPEPIESASSVSDPDSTVQVSCPTEEAVEFPGEQSRVNDVPATPVSTVKQDFTGAFKGKYENWRYIGHGEVERDGKVVYQGGWKDGQRYGDNCACDFTDPEGRQWQYNGGFFADEFAGPGELTLLQAGPADNNSPFAVKSFKGNFNLPRNKALARGDSLPQHDAPAVNLQRVRILYDRNNPPMRYIDDASSTGSTLLVLDDREAMSLGGDDLAGTVTMGKLANDFNRNKANMNEQSSDELSSAETLGDGTHGTRRYAPYNLDWTRKIDPTLGYQGLSERFGTGLVEYNDGCTFDKKDMTGLLNGKPNGGGVFTCPVCPLKYTGYMKHGSPEGRGELDFRFAEGRLGEWKNACHTVYKGEWKDGKRNGWGICTALNGMLEARGEWKDDLLHGDHCSIVVSGALPNYPEIRFKSYYGACREGRPEGYGEMVFKRLKAVDWKEDVKDYCTYRGYFSKGVREGEMGVMIDERGREIFRGAWQKDLVSGRVIKYHLPSGGGYTGEECYTGNVANGEFSGYGKLYHGASGKCIYEGMWMNNVPDGQGARYLTNGDRYEGAFKNGTPSGQGTYYFADGPSYESNWLKGKPNGQGRYTDAEGHASLLAFENGVEPEVKKSRCRGAPPTQMKLTFPDMDLGGHHYVYWSHSCKVSPDWLLTALNSSRSMWQYHLDHKSRNVTAVEQFAWEHENDVIPKASESKPKASSTAEKASSSPSMTFMDKFRRTEIAIEVKYAAGMKDKKMIGSSDATVYVLWGQRSLKTVGNKVSDGRAEWNEIKRFTEDTAFQNVVFAIFDDDSKGHPIGFGKFDIMSFLIECKDKSHAVGVYDIPLITKSGDADAGILSIRVVAAEKDPDDIKTRHEDAPIHYDHFPAVIVEALKQQANVDHIILS